MNEGWKCPECGKCYAPWVSECRNALCGVVEKSGLTVDQEWVSGSGCDHEWVSDTRGTYCIKCGVLSNWDYMINTWDGSDDSHACCTCPLCCQEKWEANASAFTNIDSIPRSQWSYTN